MKIFGVLLIAAWAVSCIYADEYRIFTAGDGRTIEAKITDYNPMRKKLCIERRGGKSLWVEPSVFSEADREYILSWIKASEFLSSKVRVTIEKHKDSQGKKGDNVHYSISLQNRTASDYEDLIFDFRLYTKTRGYQGNPDSSACYKGTLNLDRLAAGSTKTLQTEPKLMSEKYKTWTETTTYSNGTTTYDTITQKTYDTDEVGIWFRISGPADAEGQRLVREECYPKGLSKRQGWIENADPMD